jgi:hypothetical protein
MNLKIGDDKREDSAKNLSTAAFFKFKGSPCV